VRDVERRKGLENRTDKTLMRVKDAIIIIGSLVAVGTWFLGIATLPKIVENHGIRISEIEKSAIRNDLVVSGIQKDLSYLTSGVDEIKKMLKEILKP